MTKPQASQTSGPATAAPATGTPATAANRAKPDAKQVSLLWAVQPHAGEIARLHATLFDEAWDEAAVAALLAHPGSVALVACQGKQQEIGGFALAQIAADEAEILTLGVADDWRRLGIGLKLVEGIMRAAARGGAGSLFLEVADGNAAARALYARAGLVETGRRTGYYARAGGQREDAVVLKATLAPPASR